MENPKKKKIVSYIIAYAIMLFIAFIIYYLTMPALNIFSVGFWFYLSFVLLLGVLPIYYFKYDIKGFFIKVKLVITKKHVVFPKKDENKFKVAKSKQKLRFPIILICAIPFAVLILGGLFSSRVFNAHSYANVISVTDAEFKTDMPETSKVTHIALMDTDTAKIIGSRTLGSLSDVVSQYEVSENYSQINYLGTPKKVANLEYADLFKWIGNKDNGVPGYVMVDPVQNTAEYIELEKPLKYVESGYFSDDLERKLRFSYPTKIFGDARFEIDDNGNPVFIVPCMKPQVGIFGAMDVNEVIIFDPCTGNSELYSVENTPAWIDEVYDGYLACDKYNWKGTLSGGFFNSIFGNKDCKQTTDDFGYVIIGDDVWYYTGVTSVNNDKSNIGFILTNARTGEYKFYPVIGAEEHSAMAAAEGEVQEKGYTASFPALINVSGEATYIMVLKDAGGLVKLYALVNVEQYSIVATDTTQEKAIEAYNKLLISEGKISSSTPDISIDIYDVDADITVTDVRIANDTIYISAIYGDQNCVFKKAVSADESLMLVQSGDIIHVKATKTDIDRIYEINLWDFLS
ncbi:MAG: hypothetical protein J6B60_04080 [Clostridia bacterium]|nr:hypothetical protein [Clostridia bacterium]